MLRSSFRVAVTLFVGFTLAVGLSLQAAEPAPGAAKPSDPAQAAPPKPAADAAPAVTGDALETLLRHRPVT